MTETTDGFDAVLAYLKTQRGFDFTGYKRSSVERRLAKRMEVVGIETYEEYLDHLEVHPDEYAELFNTILINVTAFFRDAEAWDALREQALPQMLAAKEPGSPVRVWCAGCASGEEAYTIAMLLAEELGPEQFRARVKIYATDIDEEALEQARFGVYPSKALEGVPEELRARYFERVDQRYAFRKDLRRTLIFGRNDLVQDAPISRVDLLTCRNTLMYFNVETQSHILRRFHFALQPTGFLFLGKSEMLLTRRELFLPINLRRRIFTKVSAEDGMRLRPLLAAAGDVAAATAHSSLRDAAFEAAPVAQVVVDRQQTLVLANQAARALLGLSPADLGRPIKDLQASYRAAELRTGLDTAFVERRVVTQPPVVYATGGERRTYEVRVEPLVHDGDVAAATVTFLDITHAALMQEELERSKRELGTAYEELQSTVEELETTNEELQSTNEELETTNEELQSTNEELETMNEELQSSNEELETTNDELRQRSYELNETSAFMETVLTSIGAGVAVVDGEQRVRIWNSFAADLWGLREHEAVGTHLLALDIGLPVERLAAPLRTAIGEGVQEELRVDANDRRGFPFTCRVTIVPLTVDGGEVSGAVVLMRRENGA